MMIKIKVSDYNYDQEQIKEDFSTIERIASLMDSKFVIPGTNFRFGLDPLLNFFPFAGEAVSFIISCCLVVLIWKHGASPKVLIKMTLNVIVDAILGGIPILGKLFDFFYKANDKNVRLLKQHYHEDKHNGSGIGILLGILSIILLFFILLIYSAWKLTEWVWGFIEALF